MQLAFTFHPFGHSPSGSQHAPSNGAGAASEASPQVSPHKSGHRAEGSPEPALQSPSVSDSLGPLGQSFMNLAMSHISPSKADLADTTLDQHAYLKHGTALEGSSGVSDSPSVQILASGQNPSPSRGLPSSSVATAFPERRNFYPEEASDDESHVHSPPSRRASSSGDSGSALPAEFRCQPSPNASVGCAADDAVDKASYSSQEVYHAYRTRDVNGHQTNAYSSSPHTAHAKPPRQGYELQPKVPAWRLMGTSPLLEGQQHAQGQQQQQQPGHDQQQGYEQQPQVPQWRLLGTSPLHEGQTQHLEQPQAQQVYAGPQYQPSRQGCSQQAQGQGSLQQALGQGYQSLPQRPERHHLMGGPAPHSGHMSGTGSGTSQSFTCQGRGSAERPLSYASLAVGSWSDAVNQSRSFTKPAVSQVKSCCLFCFFDAESSHCCSCICSAVSVSSAFLRL